MRRLALLLLLLSSPHSVCAEDDKKDGDPIGGSSSKYKLEYESAKGKKKGEVLYRVRNKAGGILTPVLWKDDKTVLLDCMVPRCPKDPCDWIEAKHTYLDSVLGKTDFSYGINQDECTDEARAWRKSRDAEERKAETKQSVIATSLKGALADKEEVAHYMDIRVLCRLDGKPKEYVITYEFEIGTKGSPLALRPDKKELTLIWHSAMGTRFKSELDEMKITKLTDENKHVKVMLRNVKSVTLERGLLEIQKQGKRFAAVTAPAYRPKD